MPDDYELIYLIRNNNEEAYQKLFEKYQSLIKSKVSKYVKILSSKRVDYSDAYQEALIAFQEAIYSYNEKENTTFLTFASICINNKLSSLLKTQNTKKLRLFNESISLNYGEENNEKDILSYHIVEEDNPEYKVIRKEETEELYEKIATRLTSLEIEVLNLKLKGLLPNEIAIKLNKDLKVIYNTIQRIKDKTKNILNKND